MFSLRKYSYSNILKIWPPKNENFPKKNTDIFHISVQNIDCGYSLEPPRRGDSNEYPKSMFLSRNKKNNVYPCKPQFCYIKVGFKGVRNCIGVFSWCVNDSRVLRACSRGPCKMHWLHQERHSYLPWKANTITLIHSFESYRKKNISLTVAALDMIKRILWINMIFYPDELIQWREIFETRADPR